MHTDYLTAVSRPIAQETGRSVDTIGYALRRFDREYPDPANLPDRQHPLPAEMRARVYRQYGRGESVAALAQRFCQTPTGICRIINTMRRADHGTTAGPHRQRAVCPLALAEEGGRDLGPPAGERSAGEETADAQGCARVSGQPVRRAPADAGAGGASLSEDELSSVQGERLRAELDLDRPESGSMDRIEILHEEAVATKNQIIRANLRWWSRSPSGTWGKRGTSSSLSATGTCR